jgi:hypothetical protein
MDSDFGMVARGVERALFLEKVSNISYSILKKKHKRNFLMIYGFRSAPTDVDLEALSLIETEILAYSWEVINSIRYEWNISSIIPKIDEKNEILFV